MFSFPSFCFHYLHFKYNIQLLIHQTFAVTLLKFVEKKTYLYEIEAVLSTAPLLQLRVCFGEFLEWNERFQFEIEKKTVSEFNFQRIHFPVKLHKIAPFELKN